MKIITKALTIIAIAGLVGAVSATPIITPNAETPLTSNPAGNAIYGWEFSVTSTLTLDKLGYYDEGQDGLVDSHQIGLWNSAGALLTSATISSGTSSLLDGYFRMVDVANISLSIGTGYVIAATKIDVDRMIRAPSGLIIQPGIIYDTARYDFTGGSLIKPGLTSNHFGYYGPTFSTATSTATVPTTATLALLCLGLTGLGFSRRKVGVSVT